MKPMLAGWLWFKSIKQNHPNPASEVKVISPSLFSGVGTHRKTERCVFSSAFQHDSNVFVLEENQDVAVVYVNDP